MKLPRFGLRTLLIAVALMSIPMGWVAYQLNWIRLRHEFLDHEQGTATSYWQNEKTREVPWALRLFGEDAVRIIIIPKSKEKRAQELFPESQFFIVPEPAR